MSLEKIALGLPKQYRLKRRDDFSRIYQKGRRFKSAHLTLRVLKRSFVAALANSVSGDELVSIQVKQHRLARLPTRVGISISSKVAKRAVVRNRMRRRIQAIFRQLMAQIAPGWDLLVVAHPTAVQCDYLQFLQELEQLLIDAEVIDGNPGGCVL